MFKRLPLHAHAALWWLALCLLLAPALGHLHQVLHGPAFRAAAAATALQEQDEANLASLSRGEDGDHAHDTLASLFDGHSGKSCDLLDPMLFGVFLLPAPLPVPAQGFAPRPEGRSFDSAGVKTQRAFLARAPPAHALA
ncbi:hypothetical protein [Paracidovorax wautersii]|uniref:Uncharacterized protein n=1 Tax=Paracidovorax wautersii TaxID=1177982 RepID=A0A1I2DF97_9BURK|nr:hypothetical protein [Paracidovorax wautersii]SFE78853.1 hypothetical protein SAMN04489711_105147 [Paracidovorax wautersii]